MSSLVSFTSPLAAGGSVSSGPLSVARALSITGTAYADQNGTAYVDQGGDGVNWDNTTAVAVTGMSGVAINVTVLDRFFQVRYVNGGTGQNTFRLFADLRDPYGVFLTPALAPSAGGAYGILRWEPGPGTYTYIGRFDGIDEYNAITNAAIGAGMNAKYAAFLVASAVVSDEVIRTTTEHSPDAF